MSVLAARAQVAVCTANQPASAMKTTRAIEKFAPVMPKARVEVIVAFRPRSEPMMPPMTIRKQQIAKPMTVTMNVVPSVSAPPNMPPTISMGMHIIVPIQMKATLHQLRFSPGRIWDMPLSWAAFSVLTLLFSSILSPFLLIRFLSRCIRHGRPLGAAVPYALCYLANGMFPPS